MKKILSILLVAVISCFSATAQDLVSKLTKDASLVVCVNGTSLFENISVSEIENSLMFKELSYEMFRGKAMAKPTQFSETGVNVEDKFYFAIENTEDMIYYLFTYKIQDVNSFEKFVKSGLDKEDQFQVVNGLNILTYSADSKLVWNNEYALFISSTYIGEEYSSYNSYYDYYDYDYAYEETAYDDAVYEVEEVAIESKCEEGKCDTGVEMDEAYAKEQKEREEKYKAEQKRKEEERRKKQEKREKEREEKRLKKEKFINEHMMTRITTFFSNSTNNKIEISEFDDNAVASFWYDNMSLMDFTRPYNYGYYGYASRLPWLGIESYLSADYSGNLFLESDKINLVSKVDYDNKMAETLKNIYSTKLNKKFINYMSGDVLGYMSFSFSTEDLLIESENITKEFFENSDEKYAEEIAVYVDLVSVMLDEEAIGELVTGDALFVLNNFATKTVTYKTYEYDENFNSTRVTKTKEQLQPEFTFMIGSENEDLITKLFKLGIKHDLVVPKNSYFIIQDKYNDFPFEMYLAYKDDILFTTNSTDQIANIIAGKAEVKLASKHKKMMRKNVMSSYLNLNLMVEKVLMDGDMAKDLGMLFEIKDDLKEIYGTSKFKKGNVESNMYMTIPDGEKGSAIYLLNMIDKMIEFDSKH